MPRIPTRTYQVGIPDGQLAPYQSIEGAGALGRDIGRSVSSIAGDVFAYQANQNLVDAHLAKVERNQTLRQNLANAGLDLQSLKLDAINGPDPEGAYAKGVEALQQQWRDQYGDDEEFGQRADLLVRGSGLDVRAASMRQREQAAVGKLGNTIDVLLRTGGLSGSDAERAANVRQADEVYDQAAADGVIRADQADAGKQKYRANLDELTLRRIGQQNPDAALAALRGGRFSTIDADKRQGFDEHFQRASEADARQRQADLDRQRAIEEHETAKENAWFAVDLENGIRDGNKSARDIEAARADNRLTPSQYDGLMRTWESVNRTRLKQAEESKRVAEAVGGTGAMLNPKSKDDRDAVDVWFTQQAQGMQPDDLQGLIITTATKTGIIPPTVIGQLNGAARGSPERMAWAAGTFQTLDRQAPGSLDDLTDETKRPLRLMGQYLDAGYGPADAQKRVLGDLQVTDTVRKDRERFAREGGLASPVSLAWESFRKSADDDQSFWDRGSQGLGDDELSLELKAAYEREYTSAFQMTGNDAAAQKEAAANIKKRWWASEADGTRRWMQYPPELVYGGRDRASSVWIGQQLVDQTAQASGLPADKVRGTVSLVSDPLTARAMSAGIPPTYGVMRIDPDTGLSDLVRGPDGSPMRFQPVPPAPGELDRKAAAAEAEGRRQQRANASRAAEAAAQIPSGPLVP